MEVLTASVQAAGQEVTPLTQSTSQIKCIKSMLSINIKRCTCSGTAIKPSTSVSCAEQWETVQDRKESNSTCSLKYYCIARHVSMIVSGSCLWFNLNRTDIAMKLGGFDSR